MLSRLIMTLTFGATLVPASLFAEDNSAETDNFWIVVSSNNVIVAIDNVETQELIDKSNRMQLLISCGEYQLTSVRIDGRPTMKLECEGVTVITADDDDPDGQTFVTAKKLTYESATQTLNLTGAVNLNKNSEHRGGLSLEAESLQLKLGSNDLKIDVTGAKIRLESMYSGSAAHLSENRTSALFFMAPWCGPCQKMTPIIHALRRAGYSIELVSVDTNSELVHQYAVDTIPQFVVLDGKTVLERMTGIRTFTELKRILDRVESNPEPPPMPASAETNNASRVELRKIGVTTPYLAPAFSVARSKFAPIIQTESCHAQDSPSIWRHEKQELLTPCDHCQEYQRLQRSTNSYEPLIPDLFNAPSGDPTDSDPHRIFSFGGVGIAR